MAIVLAVDSDYDTGTEYLRKFRDAFFLTFGQRYSHQLRRCAGIDANPTDVATAMLAAKPLGFLTGSGHGLSDRFHGHNDVTIWEASGPLRSLAGAIVHLVSCHTGRLLGPRMVSRGVRAFWGYEAVFAVGRTPRFVGNPINDPAAIPIVGMDMVVLRGILAGIDGYTIVKNVDDYVQRVSRTLGQADLLRLYANRRCLVGPFKAGGAGRWGNPTAVI